MFLNPWYICGLVEGEGCFCITISKHKTKKLGFDARLMFEIEMIIEDKPLLEQLKKSLQCGRLYDLNYERYGWRPHVKFATKKFVDIQEKIIPFFRRYPLQGKKRRDFQFFCQAADIFRRREHLTQSGLDSLRQIQMRMNLRKKLKWSFAKVRENRVPGGERSLSGNA